MANYSADDHAHMALAIRLAARGRYGVRPNPLVGCVIVADGQVVGRGWHERTGEAHAEVHALADAGDRARGATAYVSLEPCNHQGRTGPCTEALIAAGIRRVCAAMLDPSPGIAGRGIERLGAAGIDASAGLLEPEARKLNPGFLSRIERGRPRVTLKIAASLDGATAMSTGESRWITSPQARADVQRLRAESGAVLTGAGTVLADDPSLTVRDLPIAEQPLRVVLDSLLRTPAGAAMLSLPGSTRIYCVDDSGREGLEAVGATVVAVDGQTGRVAIDAVLEDLARIGINDVLAECGPVLAGSLLESGRVDRLVIYQSPHIMGSETRPLALTPARDRLADRLQLDIVDVRRVGPDTKITASPRLPESDGDRAAH